MYQPQVTLSEQFAYGHKEIYERFFGFDPNKVILAELQHGWCLDSSWMGQSNLSYRQLDRRFRRYPLLVWSREIARELNYPKSKSVYAVASPWFLLLSNYENLKSRSAAPTYFETPRSALFFPTHSFPGINAHFDVNYAEKLLLSQNFSSITTSLYWIDYINPKIREEFERFSNVTCMGLRSPAATETPWHDVGGRVNFLYQLHKVMSEHQYIICEEFSTAAMAALTLGKQVFITKDKTICSLVHRSEKPILEIDYLKILTKYGLKRSLQGFGYELSDNSDVLELAQRGFGFDIPVEETGKILERLLGSASRDFKGKAPIIASTELPW